MVLNIVLILVAIFLVSLIIVSFCNPLTKEEIKNTERIDMECQFSSKLDKLLKNVTHEEQVLYRNIFDTINYTYPDKYNIEKKNTSLSQDIRSIQIRNIIIYIEKTEKSTGFSVDGSSCGRKVAKYECLGLTIIDKTTKESIELNPPKEQFAIYDLLVNYVIYKLECYYNDLQKDEEKKISEKHQNSIKKALKAVKLKI